MHTSTYALVIGNGAYPADLLLNSPRKDAEAVSGELRALKIEVIDVIDKPYLDILAAIDKFIENVNLATTKVSLLYYSGHDLQINDTNYIVPIDFRDPDKPSTTRLVSVQSIVDRMINATAVRVVLLDACRTGADATLIVGGKGVEVDKAFYFNSVPVPSPGLAEMKATGNTFIGFAAGPGEVAREGISANSLSPFTQALVKHITSVDLPLSNLTGRIRQAVLTQTGGTQRTWDQSSLTAPYYFNPGSILLFTGNMMAAAGLVISFIIYSLVLK